MLTNETLKLSVVLFALTCVQGCSSSFPPVLGPEQPATSGLNKNSTILVDGVSRSFDFYIPKDLSSSPHPLVFLFHGARSSTDALTGETISKAPYSVWMDIAESEKIIIVYPQGETGSNGDTGWNDCRIDATSNSILDDVAFVRELTDYFSQKYFIDVSRIYASGTSNGGHMSLRLALELSDKIAAVAPVVAAMPAIGCNTPVNPVSVLFMNGTTDPLLPYFIGEVAAETGGRGTVLSTKASVDLWVSFNQTDVSPVVTEFNDINVDDTSTVSRFSYATGLE